MMLTQKQALARVTEKWMQARADEPKWIDARYPLLVLMVRDKLTPYQASVKYTPHDPKRRTQRQLERLANDVVNKVLDDFGDKGDDDPVADAVNRLSQNGEVWILSLYGDRLRSALYHRGIRVETESALRVIRVDGEDPGDPFQ